MDEEQTDEQRKKLAEIMRTTGLDLEVLRVLYEQREQRERYKRLDLLMGGRQDTFIGTLASDANTVVTTTAAAVASAYAVKKILGGNDGKDGDQDSSPPMDGPSA